MRHLERLREYYLSDVFEDRTLFDIWEKGQAWGDSVTPSTYCPEYRAWIREKLALHLNDADEKLLLSLGCGNAMVESELRRRGCRVLAVDALPEAVVLAERKGLDAVVADVADWTPPHNRWDVVYADGVLGHMYDRVAHALPILQSIRGWLEPSRGVLVVSNDAAPGDEDACAAPGVPGFYWLSRRFITSQLEALGYIVLSAEHFPYERPHSGTRHRAVIAAHPTH